MKKGECDCECSNSFGIASVVLGLLGTVLGVAVFPIAISIVGLIFGIIQYRRAKNAWAIWGIVLSTIGIVISIVIVWQVIVTLNGIQNTINACTADPSLPGCEQISQIISGTTSA